MANGDMADTLAMYLIPPFYLLMAAVLLYLSFAFLRMGRTIEDTPTAKVRSAAQGMVELQGIARAAGEALVSPLSQSECLHWRYDLLRKSDKGRNYSVKEHRASTEDFYIEDETGRARVRLAGARIEAPVVKDWHDSSLPATLPPAERAWTIRRSTSIGAMGVFRLVERCIKPGDTIYVMGYFETGAAAAGQVEGEHVIRRPDHAAHYRQITWLPLDRTITVGSLSGKPFVIATESQKTLGTRYRAIAGVLFAVGFISAILGGIPILKLLGMLG